MTIEELLDKIPPEFKGIAEEYGPTLLAWTTEEIMSWIVLVSKGDVDTAYRHILAGLENHELLDEWEKLDSTWAAVNEANAKRLELQKAAILAILKVLLSIAITMVGL
jgi:hypothetical protein